MIGTFRVSLVALLLSSSLILAGGGKYTIKTATKEPPKELAAPIKELLGNEVIELHHDGKLAAEIWFAKTIPGNVAAGKAGKNVGYRDLKETSIFGAVQFHTGWMDYRKQQINPGVYTLRLGYQPQDGDHMGTSPYPEFLVLTSPKFDSKAEHLTSKALADRSAASINTTHPAVLLLFPGKEAKDKIELTAKPNDTWVLNLKRPVATDNKGQATVGIGFAIVGHTAE